MFGVKERTCIAVRIRRIFITVCKPIAARKIRTAAYASVLGRYIYRAACRIACSWPAVRCIGKYRSRSYFSESRGAVFKTQCHGEKEFAVCDFRYADRKRCDRISQRFQLLRTECRIRIAVCLHDRTDFKCGVIEIIKKRPQRKSRNPARLSRFCVQAEKRRFLYTGEDMHFRRMRDYGEHSVSIAIFIKKM